MITVPIQAVAKELALPIHNIDTFTGWAPPKPDNEPINLIIAVSFGLLVPPRILNGAQYGGLNVHPSMLPDFRGPAPLHHTLLAGRRRTGITLQTLHPQHFDHGTILAQTPYPGFEIPESDTCTVPQLVELVAPIGAAMLVQGIRDRLYVPPSKDVGLFHGREDAQSLKHAPKITSEDRHIDWNSWTAEDVLRRNRVIGPLWNIASCREYSALEKRIIWDSGFKASAATTNPELQPGVPFADGESKEQRLFVGTCDGKILEIGSAKVEGEKTAPLRLAADRAGMMSHWSESACGRFWDRLR
ncbi:MAG: Methionyl-tRNA formyltransferase [Pleopsidium flavum]|nr:MAG: Methionyl-tRNA formyltransferase [Pleopsidium flavum]